ncbi:HAMP domain-containing protein [Azospirillum sp. RWY-5-1]|uniref:HAMP domain-containing protein n=1 Tax=Azospirillum oleiclasticum TaxID=2735135 RepID=A0ABX2T6F2_9PROT|nr:methyl-accepting chemotaxis protein [Azospirillum oleiclasticum]NYZ11627.1 HAMP domain-containing protein [Azospirillum oleiclasticum]NYZ18788.1 HAMP domain-containing protein [Azospirillum oleiclasticum]
MNVLARFGIGAKIYSVVVLLGAVTVGMLWYMNGVLSSVDTKYSALIDQDVQFSIKLERMRGDTANLGRQVNNVLLLADPAGLPALVKAISDIQSSIAVTEKAVGRLAMPEHRTTITRMSDMFAKIREVMPRVYAAKERGNHDEAAAIYREDGRPLVVGVFDIAAKLSDEVNADVETASKDVSEATRQAEFRSFVVVAIMLGLGAGLSVVIAVVGIRRPLTALGAVMERLAQGDATVEIAGRDRGDEIGSMARTVEVFKENLLHNRQMEQEAKAAEIRAEAERKRLMHDLATQFEATVKGVVSQVSAAADQMQGSSQTLSSMAEEGRAQATAVAAATEQTSANVQTVASSAEEMASSIGEITRQVNESATIARRAADHAQATNTTIQSLAEQAKSIGDVVQLINSIASQTNLLALNATIEAARAGEAGKGFAVVASEVKNLATQTGKATEEISAQISAMQQATGSAVGAISEITTTIGDINQIATAIAAAIEEQDAATREIARNVQQAARGTEEISSNIANVQRAAEGTGKAAEEVLGTARELFHDSERLSQEVDRFIQQVRAA